MYQKYSRYPELIRLVGAAAVSKQFQQMLLRNPEQILEHGYLGYQFDLTTEEAAVVISAAVGDIREFSLQLWEWMGRNGQGGNNGSGPGEANRPLEGSFAGVPGSTVPVRVEEKSSADSYPFSSNSTFISWRGADMEPLILIVDDNREMAQGLRYALEMEGFRVAVASDGEIAINFLESEHPDLILADIKMPRMDGYALLRLVKQNAEWCDIPFVFVTAAADWREAVMAKSMGADEYIVKPFELEDLVSVVRRLTNEVEGVDISVAGEKKEAAP